VSVFSHLFQSSGIGLPLLPPFVDAEERSDRIHPLDQTGAGTKGNYCIVLSLVQLRLVSGIHMCVDVMWRVT